MIGCMCHIYMKHGRGPGEVNLCLEHPGTNYDENGVDRNSLTPIELRDYLVEIGERPKLEIIK